MDTSLPNPNPTPVVPAQAPIPVPVKPPSTVTPPPARKKGIFFLLGGTVFLMLLAIIASIVILPRLTAQPEEPVTLQFWGLSTPKAVMDLLIDEFEQKNPLIKVTYEEHTLLQYRKKLTTRLSNKTGPDIYEFHNSWLPMFRTSLLPLESSVISAATFADTYYPVVGADVTYGGALYGIPMTIDTLSLFVNKHIFAAAGATVPTNWNDFITVARTLTVKDEHGKIRTAGAALGTYDNITHAADILAMLLIQNGVSLTNFSTSSERVADTLQFYTAFAKGEERVWDETLDEAKLAFAKENLAMYFGYATDIAYLKEQNPSLDFAVSRVPALPDLTLTTVASYQAVGISSSTQYPQQTQKFLRFLQAKSTQQKILEETVIKSGKGVPSARKDLTSLIAENTFLQPVIESANQATSTYFVGETYDEGINAQMNGYLGNAVRAASGNNAVSDESVTALIDGITKVLSVYAQ